MHDERAIPVPPALHPWISGISVGSVTGPARTVLQPPDHAVALVLRRGELVVTGPRTRALYSRGEAGPSCLALRVRPGLAGGLLGVPLRGLADRAVPLRDLGGDLAGTLAEDVAPARLLARLATILRTRRPTAGLVTDAAALLAEGIDVRGAARRLHVSERHLRTLFADGLGLSPKRFAGIDRVRTVLAHAEDRPWRRLATDAGYSDQSHLTGEFRRFMGITLTDYVHDRLPPAPWCGG